MNPKVSIIIPVYNTEKYLEKCIDSILTQTFTDFECILIDDGSHDNSPAICDKYARKDERIKVIHKENGGVSSARNAGLDIAQGKWIGFVDSDDWCEPEMYEFLINNAEKNKADISICGICELDENKIYYKPKNCPDTIMNSEKALIRLHYYKKDIRRYLMNKIYLKKLFDKDNLRFNETIHFGEDHLILHFLFKNSKIIFYTSKILYNYRWNIDSIMRIRRKFGITKKILTYFNAMEIILKNENSKKIKYYIIASESGFAATSCLWYLKANQFKYDEKYIYLKNIVKKNIYYVLLYGNIKMKFSSILVFFPVIFYLYCKLIYR